MNDVFERRHVVLGTGGLVELEHANEHRRHDLTVGDLVLVDELQVLLRIEVLHGHDRRPEGVLRHAEAQRSSMVEGRRREVALGVVDAEQERTQAGHAVVERLERLVRERSRDALRHAGGAGRVEHVEPGDAGLVERLGRLCSDRGLVGLISVDRPVEHQPKFDVRRRRQQLRGLVCLVLRRDVGACTTVVDDVFEFDALEAGRRRRVDQPGVVAAPDHFHVAVVVLHADGDVVAWLQPRRSQQPTEPVRCSIEFGEGLCEARIRHDERRLVGVKVEMCPWDHGSGT